MPSCRPDENPEYSVVSPPTSFALSEFDRECIERLVGHTLARIERAFILQTLRYYRGNRTRAADRLGISIRSLRDKIRNYRDRGESVPGPGSGVRRN
jgi:DNA-binding NtrC family response regulator